MRNRFDGFGKKRDNMRYFRGVSGVPAYPLLTPEKESFYCSRIVELRKEILALESELGIDYGPDFDEVSRWERKVLSTISDSKLRSLYGKLYEVENAFLIHYMRYISVAAKKFVRNRGLSECSDFVQEGYLAFQHALSRFDFSRGVKFVTYAAYWMNNAFSRSALRFGGRLHKSPSTVRMILSRYNKLLDEHGKLSKENEKNLKQLIGVDKETIDSMLKADRSMNVVSLNKSVGGLKNDGGGAVLMDLISPEMMDCSFGAVYDIGVDQDIVGRVIHNRQLSIIEDCLAELSCRDRVIIKGIYSDESDKSMAEVGKDLGLSRERIRQIHDKVISGIRHRLRGVVDL